jgi:hypothetical protein
MTDSEGNHRASASTAKLVATLLGYGLVCIPLAGLAWDAASDLISGHLSAQKTAYGLPALILLLIVLRFAGRALARLDATSTSNPG